MPSDPQLNSAKDRITAIAIIWGCATGMLAIAIPLTVVTDNSLMLLGVVLIGAGVSTAAVWGTFEPQSRPNLAAMNQIKQLEARLENLETICSQEDFELPTRVLNADDEN